MTGAVSWATSLRGRLTLVVTILFAVMMFVGGWFLLERARSAWIDDIRAQDLEELETLAAQLATLDVDPDAPQGFISLPVGLDGSVYTLTDESGVVLGATETRVFSDVAVGAPNLDPVEIDPSDINPSEFDIGEVEVTTGAVRLGAATTTSLAIEHAGATHTLSATSPLAPVEAGVDALRAILWIVAPVLVALAGVFAWILTGRAFAPVAAITKRVDQITHDSLDDRVPVPTSRDEVAHLATTMNTMLDRLEASRQHQREFVSDASHELRNPVATSRAALEVALAHPDDADWTETGRAVLAEQQRLSVLVEDLLLLARLDEGAPLDNRDVDLDDLVRREAARPQPRRVDVSRVEPARVRGDQRQLARLVRNLVDNATRHAQSDVRVTVRVDDGDAVLIVEDDGPGIPHADRHRVLERFVRKDDTRSRAAGGAGLGLAIVRGVVEAHAGSVTIGESARGGAQVVVSLPLPGEQHPALP